MGYAGVGVAGFVLTGFGNLTGPGNEATLLGFGVNPLHNIVHLVIGVLGILMSTRFALTRIFGWLLFVGYGAAFGYGLFVANNPDADLLNLNAADNYLHLGSALIGLLIAVGPVKKAKKHERPVA